MIRRFFRCDRLYTAGRLCLLHFHQALRTEQVQLAVFVYAGRGHNDLFANYPLGQVPELQFGEDLQNGIPVRFFQYQFCCIKFNR
ncbi:hypothetical protein D3C86_921460 [compost metagenome]